jgi:phosphoribosyl 1,2-cyclic phosphodiesterase
MPPLRFLPLASGSRGNCYYIETPHARVLLDCGVSYKFLKAGLAAHGIEPGSLDAVLLTHTHSDHISGIGTLLRKHPLRVFVHARQQLTLDLELRRQGLAGGLTSLEVTAFTTDGFPYRDLDILPVPVSHDCDPTVAFKLWHGGQRLGVMTDLGVWEPRHALAFGDCHLLVLESNHCTDMLRRGRYPARLKARIAGQRGHLSNAQALEFTLGLPQLPRHLLLGHLSENNNRPEVASDVFASAVSATSLPVSPEAVEAASASAPPTAAASGTRRGRKKGPPAGQAMLFEVTGGAATMTVPAATPMPEASGWQARARGIPHTVLVQMTTGPMLELAA